MGKESDGWGRDWGKERVAEERWMEGNVRFFLKPTWQL